MVLEIINRFPWTFAKATEENEHTCPCTKTLPTLQMFDIVTQSEPQLFSFPEALLANLVRRSEIS